MSLEESTALLIGTGKMSGDDIEQRVAWVTERFKERCAEDSPYAMAEYIRRLVEEASVLIGVSQRGLFPFLDAVCAQHEAAFDQYPLLGEACNETRTSPIRQTLPPPPIPPTTVGPQPVDPAR